ncbi:hypothetical protein BVRB_5g117810 [Beta vulgaris subsp. vulgaris]|nr:hypothetical protein BVRB_5g117810 [Beta vulgaris subsp. vulgaris]
MVNQIMDAGLAWAKLVIGNLLPLRISMAKTQPLVLQGSVPPDGALEVETHIIHHHHLRGQSKIISMVDDVAMSVVT